MSNFGYSFKAINIPWILSHEKYGVFHVRLIRSILSKLIYTFYCRTISLLFGIKIDKKSSFIGLTKFVRKPKTSIIIGTNCSFLSKSSSNLIGINRPCIIATHLPFAKIIIGNNCGLSGTVIGAFQSISIGKDVKCGANTLITDSNWHLKDPRSGIPKAIIIEDTVWLGEGVKVLKGVNVGENSIIGAGSVVTKDIPQNAIAAGNPCKIITDLGK